MSDIAIQKHFVEFYSPGTFMSEASRKEIDSWDMEKAIQMMASITERYGARPYGFRFLTYGRTANDLDSRETARSHIYYVNCDVLTKDQILADTDPDTRILRANVEANNIERIAKPRRGWVGYYPMGNSDEAIEAPSLLLEDTTNGQ